MKIATIAAALCLIALAWGRPALASPDWEATDYALLGVALAAIYTDVESTKRLLADDPGGQELNPLLGERPSNSALNAMGVLSGIGGTLVATEIPARYRRAFLGGWAALKANLAHQNRRGYVFDGFADAMRKPVLFGLAGAALAYYALPVLTALPTPDGEGVALGLTMQF